MEPSPAGVSPASISKIAATPAAPGWRLLALAYDCLPMIPLLMITSALFLWLNGGQTVERNPGIATLEFLSMWLLVGGYFVLSWRRGGQTVGMRAWRLKVVASDGTQATLRSLWLRYAVACLTPVVGLLWTLVDRDHRALHDIAAGTLMVRLQAAKTR